MKTRLKLIPLAAVLALVAAGGVARAANLSASEAGDTAALTPDANWDIVNFTGSSNGETATGSGEFLVSGSAINGSAIAYLTEGNTNQISDTLLINFTADPNNPRGQQMSVTWTSDGDNGSGLGTLPANVFTAGDFIVEDGTSQNVPGTDWVDPTTGAPVTIPTNITFQVQSEVDAPEPASLALLSVGMIGIGALRRRRTG